jgi:hypothetical protein
MPNHLRQQVMDKVATTLTGLTTTGSNVTAGQVRPATPSTRPALLIYPAATDLLNDRYAEVVTYDGLSHQRALKRHLRLVVEGVETNIDNTLSTIAKEVEAAIGADSTLGGLVKDTRLFSTEFALNTSGSPAIGSIFMTWTIDYRTRENDATAAV